MILQLFPHLIAHICLSQFRRHYRIPAPLPSLGTDPIHDGRGAWHSHQVCHHLSAGISLAQHDRQSAAVRCSGCFLCCCGGQQRVTTSQEDENNGDESGWRRWIRDRICHGNSIGIYKRGYSQSIFGGIAGIMRYKVHQPLLDSCPRWMLHRRTVDGILQSIHQLWSRGIPIVSSSASRHCRLGACAQYGSITRGSTTIGTNQGREFRCEGTKRGLDGNFTVVSESYATNAVSTGTFLSADLCRPSAIGSNDGNVLCCAGC